MALKKSRCPKCASQGKDTSKDNLITYPDGHTHCFSCGYHTQAGTREQIMGAAVKIYPEANKLIPQLPEDFDFNIPDVPLAWIQKYLTPTQITLNNIGYSKERSMLIFPYLSKSNDLIAWQGRYFGDDPKHAKWWSQGLLQDLFHILEGKDKRNIDQKTIVLVEDIVSAIKVSEVQTALPIFGSVISTRLLTRLKFLGYNTIIIWLDPDKRKEAIKFTLMARNCGLESHPIFSDFDPKDYDVDKIRHMLD